MFMHKCGDICHGLLLSRTDAEEAGRVLANLVQSCKTDDLHTFSISFKYGLLNVPVNTVQSKGQEKLQIKTQTVLSVVCQPNLKILEAQYYRASHNSGGIQHMVYIEQTEL